MEKFSPQPTSSELSRRHGLKETLMREGSKFSVVDEALKKRAEWMREVTQVREYLAPKIVWKDPKNIIKGAEKGVSVMCVGAGKGHEMDELDQVLPKSTILGCDPHDHYTKPVKNRLETLAHDAHYLPENVTAGNLEGIEDESMDGMTFFFVLHHMSQEEQKRAFVEMRRVLKPDGYAFLAEDIVENEDERKITEKVDRKLNLELRDDLPHNYHNMEEWKEFIEKEGFEIVESKDVRPGKVRHGFMVIRKKGEA